MKYIRLENNIVQEIIPAIDPTFPEFPIEERYHTAFLETCVPVEEEVAVERNWIYNPETSGFAEPTKPELPAVEPKPDPDTDRDTMLVDLDYRMTLLELGVN